MILCRRCGTRVTAVYGDEQFHPLCDPNPRGWTLAQLDEWCAKAAARRAARPATEEVR